MKPFEFYGHWEKRRHGAVIRATFSARAPGSPPMAWVVEGIVESFSYAHGSVSSIVFREWTDSSNRFSCGAVGDTLRLTMCDDWDVLDIIVVDVAPPVFFASGTCGKCGDVGEWRGLALVCRKGHGIFAG